MEPNKVIAEFLDWLQKHPEFFLPVAWQNLPLLDENLAESDDDELFPIAMTISKWCSKHNLGEKLREKAAQRQDIEDAPTIDNTPSLKIKNVTDILRQNVKIRYEQMKKQVQGQQ
ncbi:MAG: DUF3632 domain-containing protein [Microcoleus vaginatus WJT46-NPBG5]|jgi:hypothetical protein|nr:DUF3632 domain-containing protein [Microcoleus vaginatus WJT46-NPBG5]